MYGGRGSYVKGDGSWQGAGKIHPRVTRGPRLKMEATRKSERNRGEENGIKLSIGGNCEGV